MAEKPKKQGSENPLENLDKETHQKIQEMRIIEQNFQQLLQQKQAFSYEVNETNHALEELEKAEGDVFKIVGSQIILKSTKEKLIEELKHKKELLELRLKNIEKQEKEFTEKLQSLRKDIMEKIQQ